MDDSSNITIDERNAASELRAFDSSLVLCDESGKRLIISFGGETVTAAGDLPVEEAAKVFFDAIASKYSQELHALRAERDRLQQALFDAGIRAGELTGRLVDAESKVPERETAHQ